MVFPRPQTCDACVRGVEENMKVHGAWLGDNIVFVHAGSLKSCGMPVAINKAGHASSSAGDCPVRVSFWLQP